MISWFSEDSLLLLVHCLCINFFYIYTKTSFCVHPPSQILLNGHSHWILKCIGYQKKTMSRQTCKVHISSANIEKCQWFNNFDFNTFVWLIPVSLQGNPPPLWLLGTGNGCLVLLQSPQLVHLHVLHCLICLQSKLF